MTDTAIRFIDQDDVSRLVTISDRYRGQMDTLDLTVPGKRAQLALDLGVLIGMGMRLLDAWKAQADALAGLEHQLGDALNTVRSIREAQR